MMFLSVTMTGCVQAQKEEQSMAGKSSVVVLETNQGNIEIKLFEDVAPKACENFKGLAEQGYYNGIIFHRVIKSFMVQGGDPTGTGSGGDSLWGEDFEDEFSPKVTFDRPGLLAMANRGPKTNGSQFFITTAATSWLNNHHTIFGEVVSGYDVVQKIENVKVGPGDRPVQEQKIINAYVKK
jgi:peptidylprolyl isomerase